MTVPELVQEANALYRRSATGCCLHIVLDDGNANDKDVEFCIDQAEAMRHPDCLALAKKIILLSKTQRRELRKHIQFG